MNNRLSLLIIVMLSALCGALVHRLFDLSRSESVHLLTEDGDGHLEALRSNHARLEGYRNLAATQSLHNDSLIQIRSRQRALIGMHAQTAAEPMSISYEVRTIRLREAMRIDDRLLAELVRERFRNKKLQEDYQSLLMDYDQRVEQMDNQLRLQRSLERRRRRRVVTVVVVTAAATLLLSRS